MSQAGTTESHPTVSPPPSHQSLSWLMGEVWYHYAKYAHLSAIIKRYPQAASAVFQAYNDLLLGRCGHMPSPITNGLGSDWIRLIHVSWHSSAVEWIGSRGFTPMWEVRVSGPETWECEDFLQPHPSLISFMVLVNLTETWITIGKCARMCSSVFVGRKFIHGLVSQ
jgi:hypothetical protein